MKSDAIDYSGMLKKADEFSSPQARKDREARRQQLLDDLTLQVAEALKDNEINEFLGFFKTQKKTLSYWKIKDLKMRWKINKLIRFVQKNNFPGGNLKALFSALESQKIFKV